jgi:hypothetical protein
MWIMIAGPYSSDGADQATRAERLREMNLAAYEVFRRGHTPVIGVNMALPIIETGEGSYEELMMPISFALAEKCDAILRIGGPSKGADDEVETIRAKGGAVFRSLEEILNAPRD